jgi:uncharacterized protein YciI
MPKYVLFYESSPDVLTKAPLFAAQHRALWEEFYKDGALLMIGPFTSPEEGAMGVFSTREAAEEFVQRDPFVHNGVVARWSIREWHEALVNT